MGRELYDNEPALAAALDLCAELPVRLWQLLFEDRSPAAVGDTRLAKPALFAVEYALASLPESWGVVPDAVVGHRIGELVAACVAGIPLEEAARWAPAPLRRLHDRIGLREDAGSGESIVDGIVDLVGEERPRR